MGGSQLTWDCCKATSIVVGCNARSSGALNSNYEMTNDLSSLDIAGSLASTNLLRVRIEAHAKLVYNYKLIISRMVLGRLAMPRCPLWKRSARRHACDRPE